MKKVLLPATIAAFIGTGVIATTLSETITPLTQPISMLLLGAVLVGLAGVARRKNNKRVK